MMKIQFSILMVVMLGMPVFGQTSAQTQVNGSASQNTSMQVDQSGAHAQSQTNAHAETQSGLASQPKNQSTQASSGSQLATGTTMRATLEKPIDAKKNKPGDQVIARTSENVKSDGNVIVPKGSKIIGHVSEVKARSKEDSESLVGITFDRAILKNGHEVPMSASIQAIARSEDNASAAMADDSLMAAGGASGAASGGVATGGGLVGGAGRAVGANTGTLVNTAGSVTNTAGSVLHGTAATSSTLSSSSRGVMGLNGLSLSQSATNATQGSLITSSSRNVHLDSGTQMLLRVNAE